MADPVKSLVNCALALVLSVLMTLFAIVFAAGWARAAIAPAVTIDGPSNSILDVDGAAMAPDGSGGILYRKLIDGQAHLFAARFWQGAWQAPVQVDAGQPFGASSPAIAAGDGGRLLVVWTEPWAVVGGITHYQLMSAELSPGAVGFAPALQVDPNDIGDGSAAFPSLAMAPNGNAYVVYRVVTQALGPGSTSSVIPLRAGDELVDVRVAHYSGDGLPWSYLGTINQFPQLTMRRPSASNAPVIGVSNQGDAVVVWQEPDTSGVSRIWVRRIFGNTLGNPLQVSADSAGGQPIDVDADAPALAVSTYGEARIAYRLPGGPGSPYGGARIFVNSLPPDTAPDGSKLTGLQAIDAAPTLGPPSISIEPSGNVGGFRLGYAVAGAARSVFGNDYSGNGAPIALGGTDGERVLTTVGQEGGGVSAWQGQSSSGLPVIDAREEFAGGAMQLAQLSGPISGPADPPVLAGSGEGDALIAFRQGPPGQSQVLATIVKGPPGDFLAAGPVGWVKGSAAKLSWNAAPEAFGTTTYAILVDGQVRQQGLTGLSTQLDPRGLSNGIHHVQVLATDSLGQQTRTPAVEVKIDANPPEVKVKPLGGSGVRVRVVDVASGALAQDTLIDFGDGTRAVKGRLSARHRYSRAGTYVIVVHDRSRAGNAGVAHLRVKVR
jgi:hypothetical protein